MQRLSDKRCSLVFINGWIDRRSSVIFHEVFGALIK